MMQVTTSRAFIQTLAGPAAPVAEVGGKAHHLMQLVALGCPVPPGFVLPAHAYRAFVEFNRLPDSASREAFLAGTIPPEIRQQIEAAYAAMGAGAVAVRSSATAEDLEQASFAGEQETILNVRGVPALLDAVRSCWASLWSGRVASYRHRIGYDEAGLAMGVVVQKMVDAQVAGVLFTVEPVSGHRNVLAVEACWGLGEALVGGEVTPDHYELHRANLQLRRKTRGNQSKRRDCLTPAQLRDLAQLALKIEKSFGAPQDIEWAIDGQGIHILQARPITTLQHQVEWASEVPGAIWVRRGGGGITEYLPTPPSPMYASSQLHRINELHDKHGDEMGIAAPVPSFAMLNGYVYCRQDYRFGPRGLQLPVRYWQAARRGVRQWRASLPAHLRRVDQLAAVDLKALSDRQLLHHVDALIETNSVAWDIAVRASRTWVFTEPLFRHIYRWIRPITGSDPVVFLRGFSSRTMDAEAAHCDLVRGALLDPEIEAALSLEDPQEALQRLARTPGGRLWLEDFEDYRRQYGHLVENHDYLYPAPADHPAKILASIRLRVQLAEGNPVDRQRRLAMEREQATAEAMEKLAPHPLRKAIFRWILAWVQEGASSREDVFFHALLGWPAGRRALMELGKRLVAAGSIAEAEDVFFLTLPEAKRAALGMASGELPELIASRRRQRDRQLELLPPACVPLEGPPLTISRRLKSWLKHWVVGKPIVPGEGELRGAAASPGKVTGTARIILSPSEFPRLQRGDIIVTRNATPEWTPTFAIAAGLITDSGGPLSHASILAREFGIPAVMGVQTATRTITEGQLVTLDGSEGLVQIHEHAPMPRESEQLA